MATVKGLGGAFLYSNDATRLAQWYRANLGLEMDSHPNGSEHYVVLRTRDIDSQRVRENPVFAIKQAARTLPDDRSGFMVNLRVDDLDAMLRQLRGRGVEVEPETIEWTLGKHAWIRDLDGNRVELFEELFAEGPV